MSQPPALLDSFSLDGITKEKLLKYIDILCDYNNRLNLVGSKTRNEIIEDLLIPSIICTKLVSKKVVIDIGSGSGILGIPIKLVNTNVQLILCEKNIKKVAFLNDIVIKLNIKTVNIIAKSIEHTSKNELENVEQLLIRGIKLVNIYQTLLEKFPRGTSILYFGSDEDVGQVSATVEGKTDVGGNELRDKGIFIFSLKLG